jgi:hypothetical protein
VSYFNGDLEIYPLPETPLIIPFIGIDLRADITLNSDKLGAHGEHDLGELKKLPPLNDYIRKAGILSLTDLQPKKYIKALHYIPCVSPKVPKTLDSFINNINKRKLLLADEENENKNPKN